MAMQPLLDQYRMGDLVLPNRIIMAPLTRTRARPDDHVPTALQAEYYAQRASAGLIVAEATAVSPDGFGWAGTPGLWSAECEVRGWRRITGSGGFMRAGWQRRRTDQATSAPSGNPAVRSGAPPLSLRQMSICSSRP